jgi:hypothetical protein
VLLQSPQDTSKSQREGYAFSKDRRTNSLYHLIGAHGIVVVAFRAAMAAGVLIVMIASTFKLASSAASSVSRSRFPSAQRNSRITLRPSV